MKNLNFAAVIRQDQQCKPLQWKLSIFSPLLNLLLKRTLLLIWEKFEFESSHLKGPAVSTTAICSFILPTQRNLSRCVLRYLCACVYMRVWEREREREREREKKREKERKRERKRKREREREREREKERERERERVTAIERHRQEERERKWFKCRCNTSKTETHMFVLVPAFQWVCVF